MKFTPLDRNAQATLRRTWLPAAGRARTCVQSVAGNGPERGRMSIADLIARSLNVARPWARAALSRLEPRLVPRLEPRRCPRKCAAVGYGCQLIEPVDAPRALASAEPASGCSVGPSADES